MKGKVEAPKESANDHGEVQTSLTYFTVKGGGGSVYLNALMETNEESIGDIARIIANLFSIKVQAGTIKTIRDNLIKSERPDLLAHFEKELVTATVKQQPTINTKTGEEEPCVSPSDLMT